MNGQSEQVAVISDYNISRASEQMKRRTRGCGREETNKVKGYRSRRDLDHKMRGVVADMRRELLQHAACSATTPCGSRVYGGASLEVATTHARCTCPHCGVRLLTMAGMDGEKDEGVSVYLCVDGQELWISVMFKEKREAAK